MTRRSSCLSGARNCLSRGAGTMSCAHSALSQPVSGIPSLNPERVGSQWFTLSNEACACRAECGLTGPSWGLGCRPTYRTAHPTPSTTAFPILGMLPAESGYHFQPWALPCLPSCLVWQGRAKRGISSRQGSPSGPVGAERCPRSFEPPPPPPPPALRSDQAMSCPHPIFFFWGVPGPAVLLPGWLRLVEPRHFDNG